MTNGRRHNVNADGGNGTDDEDHVEHSAVLHALRLDSELPDMEQRRRVIRELLGALDTNKPVNDGVGLTPGTASDKIQKARTCHSERRVKTTKLKPASMGSEHIQRRGCSAR